MERFGTSPAIDATRARAELSSAGEGGRDKNKPLTLFTSEFGRERFGASSLPAGDGKVNSGRICDPLDASGRSSGEAGLPRGPSDSVEVILDFFDRRRFLLLLHLKDGLLTLCDRSDRVIALRGTRTLSCFFRRPFEILNAELDREAERLDAL
jgi:hypothetical protein